MTLTPPSVCIPKREAGLFSNGLEPYGYLRHVFTELPKAETVEAIKALLPDNLNQTEVG